MDSQRAVYGTPSVEKTLGALPVVADFCRRLGIREIVDAAEPFSSSSRPPGCRSTTCRGTIDFVAELPRLENGKLYKHRLREMYRSRPGTSEFVL